MEKFKKGEKVYDKATEEEGNIVAIRYRDDGWFYEVRWRNGDKSGRNEEELYSEEEWIEYNKKNLLSWRDEE